MKPPLVPSSPAMLAVEEYCAFDFSSRLTLELLTFAPKSGSSHSCSRNASSSRCANTSPSESAPRPTTPPAAEELPPLSAVRLDSHRRGLLRLRKLCMIDFAFGLSSAFLSADSALERLLPKNMHGRSGVKVARERVRGSKSVVD